MTTGVNRMTGAPLDGWAHVEQSIIVILTTRLGARVMRRTFGFAGAGLLGRNLTPQTLLAFFSAIAIALWKWEPRFRVRRFSLDPLTTTPQTMRRGQIGIVLEGDYLPGALQGDFSIVIPKVVKA